MPAPAEERCSLHCDQPFHGSGEVFLGDDARIGGNFCGKSLLRGMVRLLKSQGGTVYLDGDAIASSSTPRKKGEGAVDALVD